MKILLQRSKESSVEIDKEIVGKINKGLVLFVGFTYNDNEKIIDKMIDKIIHLRIFKDEKGLMNLSLLDIKGEILSISQFTLYADASKGRRPSFIEALEPIRANELYNYFNKKIKEQNIRVEIGAFGADMKVHIFNDGPVTILLDSKEIISQF